MHSYVLGDMAQVFVSGTDDGVVRLLESSDPKYIGLHTTGVESCWVLMFVNQTNGRISLIHRMIKTAIQSIVNEVEFVTESDPRNEFHWHIVHNVEKFDNKHTNSREKFQIEFVEFEKEVSRVLGRRLPVCNKIEINNREASIVLHRSTFEVNEYCPHR